MSCACEGSAPVQELPSSLAREDLLDPQQCRACHPRHYEEWASSMHAYAADDPVFVAMNLRAQRETNGALGTFCLNCHAPMAVREGMTVDGTNLTDLPSKWKGVTCYFCHNATDVGQHFNNDVRLANDATMRAALVEPFASPAHAIAYGAYQDGDRRESSQLCGSCHDVVVPSGVHLERTFEEYKTSVFGRLEEGFETCAGCHMPGRNGRAAELPVAPERTVHAHLWPGVDVALSAWPGTEVQRRAIECDLALNTRIRSFDSDGLGTFTVQTETSAGHKQPSGAAQDRRMWLEVIAYDAAERVVFESGRVAEGELEEKSTSDPAYDPQLSLYRDWLYDAAGNPTHDFWKAAPSREHPDGYESLTLPLTIEPTIPHTLSARYTIPRHREIARMTVRARLRPIGLDVLQDLVASGDLDASVVARMPTFTLHGASIEWRPDEVQPRSLLPPDLSCLNDD